MKIRKRLQYLYTLLFLLITSYFSFPISILAQENIFNKLNELAQRYESAPEEFNDKVANIVLKEINAKMAAGDFDLSQWSLDNESVIKLLNAISQNNPQINPIIANIFQQRLLLQIRNADIQNIDFYYSMVLKFRPDPSLDNTSLRREIVLNSQDESIRFFALARLDEIRYLNEDDFSWKLKLYLSGFYGIQTLYLPLIFIFIVSIMLYIAKKLFPQVLAAKQKTEKVKVAVNIPDQNKEDGKVTKKIKNLFAEDTNSHGYEKKDVKEDEYSSLLSFFALDDSASEQDIKKAYREKVKSLHPDKKFDSANTDPVEFAKIKETYNRIMEIRGSWFGGHR